jgi:hypothetical protein
MQCDVEASHVLNPGEVQNEKEHFINGAFSGTFAHTGSE